MEFNFKYKVGDRVIASDNIGRNKKRPGTIVKLWLYSDHPSPYGVKFDDDLVEVLWSEVHSLIHHQQKIVVTTDGKITTAKLYENGKAVKTAEAKCCSEDTFDFNVGAKLAVERLAKVEETPKYYNGKVVCIKSGYSWWTVGKIYNVVDGRITANDGSIYPNPEFEGYFDADDVRHAGCATGRDGKSLKHNNKNEFIEIKE
jgi:hypothetical protein